MINLLPPEGKNKLLSEKKEKLLTILGIVTIISLVCLALIMLSIKFYILTETDYQKNTLWQAEQKTKTPDFMNLNSIVKKYNIILSQIDSFYGKEVYFNQVLKIVTNIPKSNGLQFASFSLLRDTSGSVQVSVSGTSDTRDDLLIFRKNIEKDKKIKNSSFSPGSWVNSKDVNFSLTLIVDQNEK